MAEIEISAHRSAMDQATYFTTKIFDSLEPRLAEHLLAEICHQIAERYVQEHYADIAAKLDQQAIANLVIAESGKKIAEEIRLTPPPPTVVKDTQIYQRGIFGGVTRVR